MTLTIFDYFGGSSGSFLLDGDSTQHSTLSRWMSNDILLWDSLCLLIQLLRTVALYKYPFSAAATTTTTTTTQTTMSSSAARPTKKAKKSPAPGPSGGGAASAIDDLTALTTAQLYSLSARRHRDQCREAVRLAQEERDRAHVSLQQIQAQLQRGEFLRGNCFFFHIHIMCYLFFLNPFRES